MIRIVIRSERTDFKGELVKENIDVELEGPIKEVSYEPMADGLQIFYFEKEETES